MSLDLEELFLMNKKLIFIKLNNKEYEKICFNFSIYDYVNDDD